MLIQKLVYLFKNRFKIVNFKMLLYFHLNGVLGFWGHEFVKEALCKTDTFIAITGVTKVFVWHEI